ncbi:transcriptional repressor [Candidatus Gracilibacteria bacterium]|nr:transcriptional repressor [Candidatus Gracilibacteria bacterium]
MPISRITLSRKRFVEVLGQNTRITFTDLKRDLVGKGDSRMNLATLYRIVDAFRDEGIIHEMTIAGERVIFPCQCENAHKDDGIVISFCENCGAIYDQHTKLASPYIGSMTYNRMKSCSACVIA